MSIGSILCSASCATWSASERRARMPPWMRGCSVFTRPSRISGEPVCSETCTAGTPLSFRCLSVPPVLRMRQPSLCRPCAKGSRPVLSETEMRAVLSIDSKILSRQKLERFEVFVARVLHHVGGELGAGRFLVPGERLEPVAQVLLVEALLVAAFGVILGGPEARGVGREHLVDEDDLAVLRAELELGVGQDHAALLRVVARALVDLEAALAQLLGEVLVAHDADHLLEGNILVVADVV